MSSAIPFAIICAFCAAIFTGIGIFATRMNTPIHFWSGTKVDPEKIRDIKAYNLANCRMWVSFSLIYWLAAVLSFWHMYSASILVGIGSLIGLPLLIFAYQHIYKRYKK